MLMAIISWLSSLASIASASIVLYSLDSFNSFDRGHIRVEEARHLHSQLSRRYMWYPGNLNWSFGYDFSILVSEIKIMCDLVDH